MEIPLSSGLTALAGLNGVGKTRVLHGVRDALLGKQPAEGRATILLKLDQNESRQDELSRLFQDLLDPKKAGGSIARLERHLLGKLSDIHIYSSSTSEQVRHALTSVFDTDLLPDAESGSEKFIIRAAEIAQSALRSGVLAVIPSDNNLQVWATLDPLAGDAVTQSVFEHLEDCWDNSLHGAEGVDPEFLDTWDEDPFDNFFWLGDRYPYAAHLLPVPIVHLFDIGYERWPVIAADADDAEAILQMTIDAVAEKLRTDDDVLAVMTGEAVEEVFEFGPITVSLPGNPIALARNLAERASDWLARLVPGAGPLDCTVEPVHRWLSTQPVRWVSKDPHTERIISVDELGHGHRRWAQFSIAVGIRRGFRREDFWLFIDEPEFALHRAAEQTVAVRLRQLAHESGVNVVAATHSPAVLIQADHPRVLGRDESGEILLATPSHKRDDLVAQLGLLPSDLFGWYQTIVLVEGAHDRAVVEGLLDTELGNNRAVVLPLGGVKDSTAVFNGEILGAFTTARLVLLIDSLGAVAEKDWIEVQRTLSESGARAAAALLRRKFGTDNGYEERFIRSTGEVLIRANQCERLTLVSLSVPDVIDLLPVQSFLDSEHSWLELRKEHARTARHGSRPRETEPFKDWLRRTKGASINTERIVRAVSELDSVPQDLIRLIDAILPAE